MEFNRARQHGEHKYHLSSVMMQDRHNSLNVYSFKKLVKCIFLW